MTSVDSTQPNASDESGHDWLHTISLILVIVGLAISGYLSYVKLTEVPLVCVANSEVFNCEVVQNSAYSRIAGVPVAWLGFVTYATLFALLLLENRIGFLRQN